MTMTTLTWGAADPLVALLLRQLLAALWPQGAHSYTGPTATFHDRPLRIPAHLAGRAAAPQGVCDDRP